MADVMEELALLLVQSAGVGYTRAAAGVAAGRSLLAQRKACTAGDTASASSSCHGSDASSSDPYAPPGVAAAGVRLSAEEAWHVQRVMYGWEDAECVHCGDGGSIYGADRGSMRAHGGARGLGSTTWHAAAETSPCSRMFVADDLTAREAGLRAAGTLANLLLRTNERITNQASK